MTNKPRIGVCLFPYETAPEFVETVRRVEDAGFSNLWITDVVLRARDVFCYLTLAAVHSRRLILGPGVLHPYSRHFAVAVNAMQTLEEIAPGRIVTGWGTGGSGIPEIGVKPAKMSVLRTIAELSRKLDAGESVSTDMPGLTSVDASLRLPDMRPLPIYFAATGPKMLQLSGEVADGVLAHVGAAPACMKYAREQIELGAQNRAPALSVPKVSLYAYVSYSETGAPMTAGCRRGVAALLGRTRLYAELAGVPGAELDRLTEAASSGAIATAASEDTVRRLSISGSAEACADKIAELVSSGVDDITLVPTGDNISEMITAFGERVLPRFR
jgi:5,10-methylenetetrahydromethanopterin reductase